MKQIISKNRKVLLWLIMIIGSILIPYEFIVRPIDKINKRFTIICTTETINHVYIQKSYVGKIICKDGKQVEFHNHEIFFNISKYETYELLVYPVTDNYFLYRGVLKIYRNNTE